MLPAIIVQRFCIMVQAVASSQTHVIFMPPAHFSTFMAQRGTIIMLGAMAPMPGIEVGIPMPCAPPVMLFAAIGFIIAVTMEADSVSEKFGKDINSGHERNLTAARRTSIATRALYIR
jgi:hypothetical protein